jgi:hypothetical protein
MGRCTQRRDLACSPSLDREGMTTHTVATTDHRSPVARTAAGSSRISTVARAASAVVATVFVAVLIAWIVAASLGLGADGHRGVGPDRPPAPDLFRTFGGGPSLVREAVVTGPLEPEHVTGSRFSAGPHDLFEGNIDTPCATLA